MSKSDYKLCTLKLFRSARFNIQIHRLKVLHATCDRQGRAHTSKHQLLQAHHGVVVLSHTCEITIQQRSESPHGREVWRLQRGTKVKLVDCIQYLHHS